MTVLNKTFSFLVLSTVNLALISGAYFLLGRFGTFFEAPPSSGDLKAVYLPLTAFAYTFQIITLSIVIVSMNWVIFKVFRFVKWYAVSELRFIYSYAIMLLCFSVLANKFDWWVRLVFQEDRYGYYTTRPATASILSGIACLVIIYVSYSQNYGKTKGTYAAVVSAAVSLILSGLAAYSVYLTL